MTIPTIVSNRTANVGLIFLISRSGPDEGIQRFGEAGGGQKQAGLPASSAGPLKE